MDLKDFQGIYKYKFILPTLYIVSWIAMFLGPSVFPIIYQRICFAVLIYMGMRLVMFGFINFVLLIGNWKIIQKVKRQKKESYQAVPQQFDEILHAFIIPSYNQDAELIAQTINFLASHKRSKHTYFIYLAMEKHELGAEQKAQQIINKFRNKFRHIDYTLHQIQQYEQKGKASNVSWCAEHLQNKFNSLMLSVQNLFLTIIDVDSWAPNAYFDQMENHINKNYQKRHIFIYQPPQIFTRNNLEVPVICRVYDYMHSSLHAANLFSFTGITFPLSNYSLSFNLAKKIGFWDTVEEAIGEDFHTTQKAIWKTQGQAIAVPIYVPFNQLNLSTGAGYCADLQARFWQAERHARGLSDIAYTVVMLLKQPFRLKTFWMALIVLQIFFMPSFVPWILLSLTYQTKILYVYTKASPQMISQQAFRWLFNLLTLGSVITFVCFEIVKRRSTIFFFGLKNESVFRMLELAIFYVPNLFLIALPAMIIAAFGSLKSNRQYIVADKVTSRKQTK